MITQIHYSLNKVSTTNIQLYVHGLNAIEIVSWDFLNFINPWPSKKSQPSAHLNPSLISTYNLQLDSSGTGQIWGYWLSQIWDFGTQSKKFRSDLAGNYRNLPGLTPKGILHKYLQFDQASSNWLVSLFLWQPLSAFGNWSCSFWWVVSWPQYPRCSLCHRIRSSYLVRSLDRPQNTTSFWSASSMRPIDNFFLSQSSLESFFAVRVSLRHPETLISRLRAELVSLTSCSHFCD